MRQPSILVLGMLAALLSGCVTTGRPKNAGVNAIDPAILRGQVNMLHYYTQGEPSVRIVAIDDQETAPFASEHHVSPGRKMVTVNVIALSFAPSGFTTHLRAVACIADVKSGAKWVYTMDTTPLNPAASGNGAIAPLAQVGHLERAVPEQQR